MAEVAPNIGGHLGTLRDVVAKPKNHNLLSTSGRQEKRVPQHLLA